MINAQRVQEFADLARDRIGDERLKGITGAAAAKSAFVRETLTGPMGAEDLASALSAIFAARRRLSRYAPGDRAAEIARLVPATVDLLHGGAPVDRRLDVFVAAAGDVLGPAAADVGADLLHFAFPDRHWLWTRWIWNPADGTGLVSLVGSGITARASGTPGDHYLRAGEELAQLRVALEAAGDAFGPMPFALDSYMAVVTALYTYMVASVRTTEEFAGILPRPAEMAARLLGARRWLPAGVDDRNRPAEGMEAGLDATAGEMNVPLAGEGGIR